MTTWCMCFYFHPVWTAQGHSDECLGITLPDMFAVALHRSDGEADRSLSVMEAVLFLMLYKQLCRPAKHSNPSVLQTGHGVLASSTNTALFHPATHSGWFIQWEHNHWYSMDVYRSRVKSFCCCCARCREGPVMTLWQTMWSAGQRRWQTSSRCRHPEQWHASAVRGSESVRVDDSCWATSPAVSHSQSWAQRHLRERSPAANTASGCHSLNKSGRLRFVCLFDCLETRNTSHKPKQKLKQILFKHKKSVCLSVVEAHFLVSDSNGVCFTWEQSCSFTVGFCWLYAGCYLLQLQQEMISLCPVVWRLWFTHGGYQC